jgi:hypothetical protein
MSGFGSVCKRQLILWLLMLGAIFCVPVSALAAGVITVITPTNGAVVTVPFEVQFTYNASSTYTKLWIDNVAIVSDHNSTETLSTFDYTVTSLAAGSHVLALQAHDTSSDTTITTNVTITVSSAPTVSVSPSSQSMLEGASFTFTSNVSATWTVSGGDDGTIPTCGAAATSCVFVANASPGTATLTATATDGSGSASASITVGPLSVTPSTPTTVVNQAQQFTANAPVDWTATCGTFPAACATTATTSCVFTAPSSVPQSPGTCTITATYTGGINAEAVDTIAAAPPPSQLNYTTWKYDNGRTGLNPNEKTLTPSNVNSKSFGLKFTDTVDGQVYAQPLFLSNVTINGGTHNVVYVATEHDTVYAFDADAAGSPLWKKSLIMNGGSSVPAGNVQSTISTEVGITGTPVIDISAGVNNGVLYVVAQTLESGNYITRLHGLDVTTGKDVSGSPVVVSGTYQGATFSAKAHMNRPALLLANGNVYLAFGPSDGDRPGVNISWQGWLFGYNATTFKQVGVWCSTPVSNGKGGIWGGGGGIAADSAGNIYATTGNGNWNGTSQFSMSWVKFDQSVSLLDFWTPYNESTLSDNDWDLGSGGILVVPDGASSQFPRELIGCGKPVPIYVVNRDNMGGHMSGSDSQIIQSLSNVIGGGTGSHSNDHCFSTPAYWNGNLYFVGNADVMKMFKLDSSTGKLATTAGSKGTYTYSFPGGQPVVSANGTTNGVVWALDYTSYDLHAYNATNLSTELYRSSSVGQTKWTVPTVINGKVYVVSKGTLSVFGLF